MIHVFFNLCTCLSYFSLFLSSNRNSLFGPVLWSTLILPIPGRPYFYVSTFFSKVLTKISKSGKLRDLKGYKISTKHYNITTFYRQSIYMSSLMAFTLWQVRKTSKIAHHRVRVGIRWARVRLWLELKFENNTGYFESGIKIDFTYTWFVTKPTGNLLQMFLMT